MNAFSPNAWHLNQLHQADAQRAAHHQHLGALATCRASQRTSVKLVRIIVQSVHAVAAIIR